MLGFWKIALSGDSENWTSVLHHKVLYRSGGEMAQRELQPC
jgi:hypothetical protein